MTRKVVLMVGVGPTFMASRLKASCLCHILYSHYKIEFLNSCKTGQVCFKDC